MLNADKNLLMKVIV